MLYYMFTIQVECFENDEGFEREFRARNWHAAAWQAVAEWITQNAARLEEVPTEVRTEEWDEEEGTVAVGLFAPNGHLLSSLNVECTDVAPVREDPEHGGA